MNNVINKTHWYDGWFYDLFIAPNQDRLFLQIKELLEPSSTVIDVGCGTGRLAFILADKVSKIVGIDLSQKNIEKAKLKLQKNPNEKISFIHTNIASIISKNEKFDYAIMTYVIHEVNEAERVELLKQLSSIANKIIIGDYFVSKSPGLGSKFNELIEFLAGKDHYANYKSYIRRGGIKKIADEAGLKILKEIKNNSLTNHLVIVGI